MNIRPWLIISRVSNLPTVWSNVTAGWLLAQGLRLRPIGSSFANLPPEPIAWGGLLLLLWGISLTYAGGMILNDVFDAGWDAKRRSNRPIPSGQISLRDALWVGWGAIAMGFICTLLAAPAAVRLNVAFAALLLALCIIVYNRWHKGVSWAPIIMGACRACLPPLGFFVAGEKLFLLPISDADCIVFSHMLALWMLTFGITMVARHEATGGSAGRWVEGILFLAPLPLIWAVGLFWPWALLGASLYFSWLVRSNMRHPLPMGLGARVADRLASMPLIDVMVNGSLVYMSCQLLLKPKGVHPEAIINAYYLLVLSVATSPLAMRLVLRWRKTIPST